MLTRPVLTTHDIAELLTVSEPAVRQRIRQENLRAVRLGRGFCVAAKNLDALLNAHATRAPDHPPDAVGA